MRNLAVNRIGVLIISLALFAGLALGQDLGSANKLFRKGKKAASTKSTKKTPARSKVSSKKSSTARKTTATRSAKRTGTPKADTEPVKGRFESFAGETKAPVKLSVADERRVEELIGRANAARDRRDYSAAEIAYKQANELDPGDWRAVYGLGNIFSDQHRWEDAENAYRAAVRIDPSNAFANIALSYVLTQPLVLPNLSERYAEAETVALRATELAPSNALAYDQLGVAMELRGLIGKETENIYRKAISIDSGFAPAYAHLGRLLRRSGMMTESAAAYRDAVSRSSDVGTTVLVAEVMQSEQRYADSEPLLRRALSRDPKNAAAMILLGRSLTAQAKYLDAEQTLRKSVAASSNAFMPNSLLGNLLLRQGKFEPAENALLQAVRFVTPLEKRGLALQFKSLGDAYKKAGDSAKAQRSYRQAVSLDGDSRYVADSLPKKMS